MDDKLIQRARDIIRQKCGGGNKGHCVLALTGPDGYPVASTISISQADGIRWLTFCTGGSSKTDRIAHSDKASVCVSSEEYNITLIGKIQVVTDLAVKKEMWYPGKGQHFSGHDAPGLVVLKFITERYNLLVDWEEARGSL